MKQDYDGTDELGMTAEGSQPPGAMQIINTAPSDEGKLHEPITGRKRAPESKAQMNFRSWPERQVGRVHEKIQNEM